LIANISNNDNEEDYSNLKQIIKESIKTVITENKKLISVCRSRRYFDWSDSNTLRILPDERI
jgi:hypothetical protein